GVLLVRGRLQDLPERGAVGMAAVHQLRHVPEAHIAGQQFLVVEDANAAAPRLGVPVEGEVHFFDAVAFRARAEFRFGAGCRAVEQDVVGCVHSQLPVASCPLPVTSCPFDVCGASRRAFISNVPSARFSSRKFSMSVPISRPPDASPPSWAPHAPSGPSYPSSPSSTSSPAPVRRSSGTSRRSRHPVRDGSTSRSRD